MRMPATAAFGCCGSRDFGRLPVHQIVRTEYSLMGSSFVTKSGPSATAWAILDNDLPVRRHADDVLAGIDEVARARRQTFRRSERPEEGARVEQMGGSSARSRTLRLLHR